MARVIGWQEDGSYVPCDRCHWTPPPPDPNERQRPGRVLVPMNSVGCATHHGDCPLVSLPPEARKRLQEKLDDIAACRRRAMADAHNYVIG